MDAPLYRAARKFLRRKDHSLHVPLHGRGPGAPWLRRAGFASFMKWDLTELGPLDDLHLPRGAIKKAQELASRLFRSQETFFLVNGVTGGLLALLMAFSRPGDKVILTRLAHKGVLHGLILSGATPIYLPVEKEPFSGFPLNVSPQAVEMALQKNPDTVMVLITSPSYWGVAADLFAIRKITEKYGVMLAVDEAHGSHLSFYGKKIPHGATAGAHVWLQSAHKSLGALTPGAFLHLGEGVPAAKIRFWLQALQTSSPSYPVMISLDLTRRQMALEGKRIFHRLWEWGLHFRRELRRKGFPFLQEEEVIREGFFLDPCRITLFFPRGDGRLFSRMLAEKGYRVELEADSYLLAVCGPSELFFPAGKFLKTLCAIRSAAGRIVHAGDANFTFRDFPPVFFSPAHPARGGKGREGAFSALSLPPRDALAASRISVPLEHAAGEICGEMVVPSPPGIPFVVPGEVLTGEMVDFLRRIRSEGGGVQGAADPSLRRITVVRKT